MSALEQILILMAFCALMLFLNLKSGGRHWTSVFLKVSSFCLILVSLVLLVLKIAQVVL